MRPGGLDGSLDNGVGTSTGIDDDSSDLIIFLCGGDFPINKSSSHTPLDSRVSTRCVNGAGLGIKIKELRFLI